MTFATPFVLGIAAVTALGVVAWHLLATERPRALPFPTARFIPVAEPRATARLSRPSDLWLLLLRVVAVLALGAAFAGPRPASRAQGLVRVFVVDGAAVGAPDSVRARHADRDTTVWFDSAARSAQEGISAGVARAFGALSKLQRAGDRFELVVVGPIDAGQVDAATGAMLARWPGAVRVIRTARVTARASDPALVRGAPLSSADSAAARAGRAVVHWPNAVADTGTADAVGTRDRIVVARLVRLGTPGHGRAVARWADGSPAATETTLGAGCVRDVAIGVPRAGDLAIRNDWTAFRDELLAPCGPEHRQLKASVVAAWGRDSALATATLPLRETDRRWQLILLALGVFALVGEHLLRRDGGTP